MKKKRLEARSDGESGSLPARDPWYVDARGTYHQISGYGAAVPSRAGRLPCIGDPATIPGRYAAAAANRAYGTTAWSPSACVNHAGNRAPVLACRCPGVTTQDQSVINRNGAWSVNPSLLRAVRGWRPWDEETGDAVGSELAEDAACPEIICYTGGNYGEGVIVNGRPLYIDVAALLLARLPYPTGARPLDGPFIGFEYAKTGQMLQFKHPDCNVWRADVPVNPGRNWAGYFLVADIGLGTALEVLDAFFCGEDYLRRAKFRMKRQFSSTAEFVDLWRRW